MRPQSGARLGFTMLELLIAVSLTAIVGLLSAVFVEATFRSTDTITRSVQIIARESEGPALWRDLLLHVHRSALADEARRPFVGDPSSVQLTSDCPGPLGFRRRCGVFAETFRTATETGLRFSTLGRTWVVRTRGAVSLRFMVPSTGDASWIDSWGESERVPVGIALVGASDTLVYRVGVLR